MEPEDKPIIAEIKPFPVDDKWYEEKDATLRYYKYLASQVDWDEWPGGAAEIVSAYETRGERLDEVIKERDYLKEKLEETHEELMKWVNRDIREQLTRLGQDD